MYPMKLRPALKDYLWGGDLLKQRYGKRTDRDIVAESWEVSCFPGSESVVENGVLAGNTLPDALGEGKAFPILVKLIDARQALSLQVHPANEYARRVEGQNGKSEMWYVIDCLPGAELILGFENPLSKKEAAAAIADGSILNAVRRVKVKPGDCYLIPAGMLHAIGAGILIAEVQQNSNVTYRVFDYDRVGPDGKKRELHVAKAVDVLDTPMQAVNTGQTTPQQREGYRLQSLCDWQYFAAVLLEVQTSAPLVGNTRRFSCLTVLEGAPRLCWAGDPLDIAPGESVFLPAGMGDCMLEGDCKALVVSA